MKPFIGITCAWDDQNGKYYLNKSYVEAVLAGGGVPLPLAYTRDRAVMEGIAGMVSGLVFSGGPDVDPKYFDEEPIPASGEISPDRDYFEIDLAKLAISRKLPLLGICRGMQVINIAAGGDIFQDIQSQCGSGCIKHFQQAPGWYPTHNISIDTGTRLYSILGADKVRVNSYHHQSVRREAPGFIISARSDDGIIEAVEMPGDVFAVCLQCHPEHLWQGSPGFLNLFKELVRAGKNIKSITG